MTRTRWWSAALALAAMAPTTGCDPAPAACAPFCTDAAGRDAGTGDAGSGAYPPSQLPVDCRPAMRTTSTSGNPTAPECLGPNGSGDPLDRVGVQIDSGYLDESSDTLVVAGYSAIMTVTLDGVSSMLSGPYEDLATGPQLVGTGPEWPSGTIFEIHEWTDGNIIVMAEDGFYLVDRGDGTRSFYRDYAGVPVENHIREEAGFTLDEAGNIYAVLARQSSSGGCGVIRFGPTGDGVVVTHSGDPGREVGTGPDDGISEYADILWFEDAIYLLNMDTDGLLHVTPSSGNRRYISRPGVGEDIDGEHAIAGNSAGNAFLFIDASENAAYAISTNVINPAGHYQTRIDLATGDRSYINDYFAFYRQNTWFVTNLDMPFGVPLAYDEANGLVYTTPYSTAIRVIDLEQGNYNWITYPD